MVEYRDGIVGTSPEAQEMFLELRDVLLRHSFRVHGSEMIGVLAYTAGIAKSLVVTAGIMTSDECDQSIRNNADMGASEATSRLLEGLGVRKQ